MCWPASVFEDLIIRVVLVCAIFGFIQILRPWVIGLFGGKGAPSDDIFYIALWAVVAIWVVVLCVELFDCGVRAGGLWMYQATNMG